MKIYLVRHTPVALPLGTCYGQTDAELAPDWQNDFIQVQEKLQANIAEAIDAETVFYSSPLQRCLKLARHLNPEVITDQRLMEFNFGAWEQLRWDDIPRDEIDLWRQDYMDTTVPGGENFRQLFERSGAFYHDLLQNHVETATVVVITHSGVIIALLARLLGLSPPELFRLKADYGSISAITAEGDWIQIDYINR